MDVSDTTQSASGSLLAITVTNFFASIPAPVNITSASATSLAVGRLGATTPAFTVDSSTASQVAGLKVTGAATGGTVALVVTDSGADASVSLNAKGSGTITLAGTSTGNVVVGRPISIAGAAAGQITFPASQNASADANTLDDYEEGTFTPAVAFGGGTTGITYTTQTGTYTKVGNVVMFTAQVLLSAKGSSTGAAALTGLPFAANATGLFALAMRTETVAFANQIMCRVNAGATTVRLEETTEAGTVTDITDVEFSNTSNVIVSGCYRL